MRKILISVSLLFFVASVFAQKSINNYKYILVPNQFTFTKTPDQYQVNSLTKFLFERAGFITYMESEKNVEIVQNNCLALKANIVDESSMFSTKIKIELLDCYNVKVFETQLVKSKEKEFKKAYHEAIRTAFLDIENLNYKYTPLKTVVPKKEVVKTEVEVKPEVKEVVTPNVVKPVVEKKEKIVKSPEVVKTEVDNQKVIPVKKPKNVIKKSITYKTIEGSFLFKQWGKSTIAKEGENYVAKGGDENFQFATIYKTSTPGIYIIKYVMSKQPRLVKMTTEGNLKIDSNNGVVEAKRM